jgi:hypothetical protein
MFGIMNSYSKNPIRLPVNRKSVKVPMLLSSYRLTCRTDGQTDFIKVSDENDVMSLLMIFCFLTLIDDVCYCYIVATIADREQQENERSY